MGPYLVEIEVKIFKAIFINSIQTRQEGQVSSPDICQTGGQYAERGRGRSYHYYGPSRLTNTGYIAN